MKVIGLQAELMVLALSSQIRNKNRHMQVIGLLTNNKVKAKRFSPMVLFMRARSNKGKNKFKVISVGLMARVIEAASIKTLNMVNAR